MSIIHVAEVLSSASGSELEQLPPIRFLLVGPVRG